VIPLATSYTRATSIDEALQALRDGAKPIAGGQSLVPMMRLRLASPDALVDLAGIKELTGIRQEGGEIVIGAMTRHRAVATSADVRRGARAVAQAAAGIGSPAVRNRGTIGGSLAHGDPASDLPAVMLAFEGSLSVQSPSGSRDIAAADMFQDYLTTALEPTEVITSISIPALDGYGYGYEKFARRAEDWAMVGVVALVKSNGGTCEDVRIGLTHMGSTPLRATAAEEALRGQSLSPESIAAAAEQAAEGTDPPADLNATQEYKRHLARVLTRRALEAAAS
jgi:carbon-monoxide dehydrogenase medium subunit